MKLMINGQDRIVDAADDVSLLYVLRNDLALIAPKFGCGHGSCGACAVLVNGKVTRSCVVPVSAVEGTSVTTLEGMSSDAVGRAVQQAFVVEQAAQCGYCSNGMIIAATALLRGNPRPSRAEICAALDDHLCRCGAHLRIIRAVERAAGTMNR